MIRQKHFVIGFLKKYGNLGQYYLKFRKEVIMRNTKGVTLIELLIVLAIMGIIAAIAIPGYLGHQRRAQRAEATSNLENLRMLMEAYFADNGTYVLPGGSPIKYEVGDTTLSSAGNLVGFKPGSPEDLAFDYQIVSTAATFTATATGRSGTRVSGDTFTIDEDNVRSGPW